MRQITLKKLSLRIAALTAAALLVFAVPTFAGTGEVDLETEIDNATTELAVKVALLEKIGWSMLTVDVEVEGDHATLMGTANARDHQELAEEVAKSVDGVTRVTNKLTLEAEESETPAGDAVANAEKEVKDAVLESRVKTKLIGEMGLNAFDIEVEATDGDVSLRGELADQEHKKIALDTAKDCEGVDSVVDLLSVAS